MKKIKFLAKWLLYKIQLSHKRKYSKSLRDFRFNFHSQNGEDGIVAELFRRLGITRGWAVEFGAWDGVYLSNTFHLVEYGFRAVYIESEPHRFQDLLATCKRYPNIIPLEAFVSPQGPNSLDSLLSQTPLPKKFEIICIDVDSIDYHIWENFKQYSPKVVIIEINSSIPEGERRICDPTTSFTSMVELGKEKGYTCVCHSGNLFFVRDDLISFVRPFKLEFFRK